MNPLERLLKAALNALQTTDNFIVKGTLSLPDRRPLVAFTIKAFDKDLRQEELLGETVTNTNGYYEISYTSNQFAKTEQGSADLIIRVYTQDKILLATSDIRFNAKTEETIDLTVDPQKAPKPSEFEILMANLTPVLGEVQLTELTEEDAVFLIGEVKLKTPPLTKEFFQSLCQAAQNVLQTGLPIEVFYAFLRANLPSELDQLLQLTLEELGKVLLNALDSNIIPARLRDTLNQIIERIEQLKVEQGVLVQRQFTGQLLNQNSGNSLVGFSVQTFDLYAATDPKDIGSDITDSRGLFVVAYFIPANTFIGQTPPNRRFHLIISNPQGEAITETDLQVPINQEQVVEIRVAVPEIPKPPSPVIEELATTLNLEIPQELRSFLVDRKLNTLADIRNVGGLSNLERLPVAADSLIIRTLDAHTNLNTLSTDLQFNATLIDRGYSSPVAIATAPRTNFVSTAHERLGDFKAAQLQVISRAQTQFLNNVLTGLQADSANGFPSPIAIPNLLPDENCSCRDCEAAVIPGAYLADLLDYALNHLKNNNSLIDLQFLTDTFHQPFGELPTSCSSVQKQLRQVRLCIEVLRHYLTANLPTTTQQPVLEQAERQYRLTLKE